MKASWLFKAPFFCQLAIAGVLAIRLHVAGFRLVLQICAEDVIFQYADQANIFDREEHFDPPVKVARHEIGAAEIDFLVSAVAEVEDAAVFQEAADDAGDLECCR